MLNILYSVLGVPNIRRLEWLPTSILNIIYNTVRYKADRIQGTLLVNPATVPCFADIIIMFIQKSL